MQDVEYVLLRDPCACCRVGYISHELHHLHLQVCLFISVIQELPLMLGCLCALVLIMYVWLSMMIATQISIMGMEC